MGESRFTSTHFLVRYSPKGESPMSPSQRPLNEKPFLYAMSLIEGKWKLHILF